MPAGFPNRVPSYGPIQRPVSSLSDRPQDFGFTGRGFLGMIQAERLYATGYKSSAHAFTTRRKWLSCRSDSAIPGEDPMEISLPARNVLFYGGIPSS